jgi:hypothetical protein
MTTATPGSPFGATYTETQLVNAFNTMGLVSQGPTDTIAAQATNNGANLNPFIVNVMP